MNTNIHTNKRNLTFNPGGSVGTLARRSMALCAAAGLLACLGATADDDARPEQHIKTVFVIAMENHNFTQPNPTNNPQQILGNPAAPFINSLLIPGNPNSAQVSYATAYFNAGFHVHPSEPNYVWAEAGTDFGVHTDADPNPTNGNTFYSQSNHLTGLLNLAGISWNNYQEDVQLSASPTNSAVGTNGPLNPYYGTGQYNYAVKHNPMAFFADTATQNVHPLSDLLMDVSNNTVARYNWITPNQYNDAHSILSGGFTYQGVHYTGDQAAIAQGDNFLSQITPQLMASKAYQDNGAIIIWWDETENGDDTNRTIPEMVISPLAKGNAYASDVSLNHSSDIKTLEELFRLPLLNNPIPLNETNSAGGYNNVALVNDLSDLFLPGAIPAPVSFDVHRAGLVYDKHTQNYLQLVNVKNTSSSPAPAPLFLVLDNLTPGVSLVNSNGTTSVLAPLGSPYVEIPVRHNRDENANDADASLRPHESVPVLLEFRNSGGAPVDFDARVLDVIPAP